MQDISPETPLNLKSRKISFACNLLLTVTQSLRNFVQSTAVILPWSVQNCKTIRRTDTDIMDEWVFVRFTLQMDFEDTSYIVTADQVSNACITMTS